MAGMTFLVEEAARDGRDLSCPEKRPCLAYVCLFYSYTDKPPSSHAGCWYTVFQAQDSYNSKALQLPARSHMLSPPLTT